MKISKAIIIVVIFLTLLSTILLFMQQKSLKSQIVPSSHISIPSPNPKYGLHKDIIATVFWVGEKASKDNDFIGNDKSAWDSNWVKSFGGIDTPNKRNGFYPRNFEPNENPFYIALPFSDYNKKGKKANWDKISWYDKELASRSGSLLKNRWIKIIYKGNSCFAQWENVGPYETDDWEYVFGEAEPKNQFGQKAGIDISPAVRDCLQAGGVSKVDWYFIDEEEVPNGPWKEIITTSEPSW